MRCHSIRALILLLSAHLVLAAPAALYIDSNDLMARDYADGTLQPRIYLQPSSKQAEFAKALAAAREAKKTAAAKKASKVSKAAAAAEKQRLDRLRAAKLAKNNKAYAKAAFKNALNFENSNYQKHQAKLLMEVDNVQHSKTKYNEGEEAKAEKAFESALKAQRLDREKAAAAAAAKKAVEEAAKKKAAKKLLAEKSAVRKKKAAAQRLNRRSDNGTDQTKEQTGKDQKAKKKGGILGLGVRIGKGKGKKSGHTIHYGTKSNCKKTYNSKSYGKDRNDGFGDDAFGDPYGYGDDGFGGCHGNHDEKNGHRRGSSHGHGGKSGSEKFFGGKFGGDGGGGLSKPSDFSAKDKNGKFDKYGNFHKFKGVKKGKKAKSHGVKKDQKKD